MYRVEELLETVLRRLQKEEPLCRGTRIGTASLSNIVIDLSGVEQKFRDRCVKKIFRFLVVALYPRGKVPILREDKERWVVIEIANLSDLIAGEDIVVQSIVRAVLNRALYKGLILSRETVEELKRLRHIEKVYRGDKVVLKSVDKVLDRVARLCVEVGVCRGERDEVVLDRRIIEWYAE